MSDGPIVAYAVGIVCATCAGEDVDDEPCANALTASELADGDVCMECRLAWDATARMWVLDLDLDEWGDDE